MVERVQQHLEVVQRAEPLLGAFEVAHQQRRPPQRDRLGEFDAIAEFLHGHSQRMKTLGEIDTGRVVQEGTPSELAASQVFEAPIAAALVLALLATTWVYADPPRVLTNFVGVLVLLPVVLVVHRLASPVMVPGGRP